MIIILLISISSVLVGSIGSGSGVLLGVGLGVSGGFAGAELDVTSGFTVELVASGGFVSKSGGAAAGEPVSVSAGSSLITSALLDGSGVCAPVAPVLSVAVTVELVSSLIKLLFVLLQAVKASNINSIIVGIIRFIGILLSIPIVFFTPVKCVNPIHFLICQFKIKDGDILLDVVGIA